MMKRPGRGETEEDLLKFQELFEAGGIAPSAVVQRVKTEGQADKRTHDNQIQPERDVVSLQGGQFSDAPTSATIPPKKKSKFQELRESKKVKQEESDVDPSELLDRYDRHITTVLSEIMERDTKQCPIRLPNVTERGFPSVMHRGSVTSQGKNGHSKNKSLFAQQFAQSSPSDYGIVNTSPVLIPPADSNQPTGSLSSGFYSNPVSMETDTSVMSSTVQPSALSGLSSALITGAGLLSSHVQSTESAEKEHARIHQENVDRLAEMSQNEILEEQKKIRESLDPSLLAFLQARVIGKNKPPQEAEKQMECSLPQDNTKCQSDSKKRVTFQTEPMQYKSNISSEESSDVLPGFKVEKEWLHMDTVESDKLQWMKNCPKPSAKHLQGGVQARFDFNGNLIPHDADLPSYLGLHHHGDEPESAGYTLEELFHLSRSNFLQQRVLTLQMLAKVTAKSKLGEYTDQLQSDVFETLQEAGLPFLLRLSMDDSSISVLAAAVEGISSMLVSHDEEVAVDSLFMLFRGYELPTLSPVIDEDEGRLPGEEKRKLSDAELVKLDLVKGLIKMQILPRLRYLLEVCHPTPPMVLDILDILIRIGRHSLQSANEIVRCPRLVDTICHMFLPTLWSREADLVNVTEVVKSFPLVKAAKLMRVLASAGRHLTSTLITKHKLIQRLLRYIIVPPADLDLDSADELKVESLSVWTVCIGYGLACDQFREIYSSIMEQVQKLSEVDLSESQSRKTILHGTSLLRLIEAVVHVAATAAVKPTEGDSLGSPPINWSLIIGLFEPIKQIVCQWLQQAITKQVKLLGEGTLLLSTGLHLLASYYSKLTMQVFYDSVSTVQEVEGLVTNVVVPFMSCKCFTMVLTQLRKFHSSESASVFSPPSLPCLPSFVCQQSSDIPVPPLVRNDSPFILHCGLMRLLLQSVNIHKGIIMQLQSFLLNEDVLEYLRICVNLHQNNKDHREVTWFTRVESHFQFFLLKLFFKMVQEKSSENSELLIVIPVYHKAALRLFTRLLPGDEHYAHDLMSTVLFHQHSYCEGIGGLPSAIRKDLSKLSLSSHGLSSPPQPTIEKSTQQTRGSLLQDAYDNLPAIRETFIKTFGKSTKSLLKSRALCLHLPADTSSLLHSSAPDSLIPADWMFLPIMDLYNKAYSIEMSGQLIEGLTDPSLAVVQNTLRLILLLEAWRPQAMSPVSMVARVTRIMCIFLTGNDLFLNDTVHNYLQRLLKIFTHPLHLEQLDFNEAVPGLTSFYDLYIDVVTQYAAVSFGDALFACYVALPLQQRYDIQLKKAIWTEHSSVLRAFSLPISQLPVPVDVYLYPIEQDESLLLTYLRALATGVVRVQWCPLFYLIGVHHLSCFIFNQLTVKDLGLVKRKLKMLDLVLKVDDQIVKNDIIYYHKSSCEAAKGFELFTSLPPTRELVMRNRQNLEQACSLFFTTDT